MWCVSTIDLHFQGRGFPLYGECLGTVWPISATLSHSLRLCPTLYPTHKSNCITDCSSNLHSKCCFLLPERKEGQRLKGSMLLDGARLLPCVPSQIHEYAWTTDLSTPCILMKFPFLCAFVILQVVIDMDILVFSSGWKVVGERSWVRGHAGEVVGERSWVRGLGWEVIGERSYVKGCGWKVVGERSWVLLLLCVYIWVARSLYPWWGATLVKGYFIEYRIRDRPIQPLIIAYP